jgi:hypothetical protein
MQKKQHLEGLPNGKTLEVVFYWNGVITVNVVV